MMSEEQNQRDEANQRKATKLKNHWLSLHLLNSWAMSIKSTFLHFFSCCNVGFLAKRSKSNSIVLLKLKKKKHQPEIWKTHVLLLPVFHLLLLICSLDTNPLSFFCYFVKWHWVSFVCLFYWWNIKIKQSKRRLFTIFKINLMLQFGDHSSLQPSTRKHHQVESEAGISGS